MCLAMRLLIPAVLIVLVSFQSIAEDASLERRVSISGWVPNVSLSYTYLSVSGSAVFAHLEWDLEGILFGKSHRMLQAFEQTQKEMMAERDDFVAKGKRITLAGGILSDNPFVNRVTRIAERIAAAEL